MTATRKKATNLSLDADLVAEAKELGVPLSAAAEAGVRQAVQDIKQAQWVKQNKDSLDSYNAWIERNGLPLEKARMF